jgi:MoxR-like ATPase
VMASKMRALLAGRFNAAFEDVAAAALPALRHRVILNFEGEADRVDADRVVADVLGHVAETTT